MPKREKTVHTKEHRGHETTGQLLHFLWEDTLNINLIIQQSFSSKETNHYSKERKIRKTVHGSFIHNREKLNTGWLSFIWRAWDRKCFRFWIFSCFWNTSIHTCLHTHMNICEWNILGTELKTKHTIHSWLTYTLYTLSNANFIQYFLSVHVFWLQPLVTESEEWNPHFVIQHHMKYFGFWNILDFQMRPNFSLTDR